MGMAKKVDKRPMMTNELLALIGAAMEDLDDRIADISYDGDNNSGELIITLHNGMEFTLSSSKIKVDQLK